MRWSLRLIMRFITAYFRAFFCFPCNETRPPSAGHGSPLSPRCPPGPLTPCPPSPCCHHHQHHQHQFRRLHPASPCPAPPGRAGPAVTSRGGRAGSRRSGAGALGNQRGEGAAAPGGCPQRGRGRAARPRGGPPGGGSPAAGVPVLPRSAPGCGGLPKEPRCFIPSLRASGSKALEGGVGAWVVGAGKGEPGLTALRSLLCVPGLARSCGCWCHTDTSGSG